MQTNEPKCNECGGDLAVQVSPGSNTPPVYYCPHLHTPPRAATISFDQLGMLFELKREHDGLLLEQSRMLVVIDPGETDPDLHRRLSRATIEITDAHGRRARVKAYPDKAAKLMAATITRRLDGIEQKMTTLGITNIKRELPPEPAYDDLDDEMPF
jgi:hypothetical protein